MTQPERSNVVSPAEERAGLVGQAVTFATAYLRFVDSVKDGGLSYPRLRLLEQLHCVGPAMMRELADQLGLTPRNMTALVDALESEGLVVRRAHPTDRRATLVELTDAGVEAADKTLAPRLEAIGRLFDDLTPDQRDQLSGAIATLLEGMRSRGQRA